MVQEEITEDTKRQKWAA